VDLLRQGGREVLRLIERVVVELEMVEVCEAVAA
jgi:hypothetical protein